MTVVGTEHTRLIVLRGPSGSGKTSTTRQLRQHLGRSLAIVEQDYLRRIVLKERETPDGANIGLISQTARYVLDRGYDVVVEGHLRSDYYGVMLKSLAQDHQGATRFYYFDVTWNETVRRHYTRPQSTEFGPDKMRQWWRHRDLLGVHGEKLIPESSTLDETTERILREVFNRPAAAPK